MSGSNQLLHQTNMSFLTKCKAVENTKVIRSSEFVKCLQRLEIIPRKLLFERSMSQSVNFYLWYHHRHCAYSNHDITDGLIDFWWWGRELDHHNQPTPKCKSSFDIRSETAFTCLKHHTSQGYQRIIKTIQLFGEEYDSREIRENAIHCQRSTKD